MRRTLVSIVVGVGTGLMACLLLLGGLFVFYPAWLDNPRPDAPPPPATPTQLSFWGNTPAPFASQTPAPVLPTLPPPVVSGACGGPEQMTIALLGVDDRGQNYANTSRTDAITLVHVNFANRSAALLSFPRDLYVPLPNLENQGILQDRLNTAFEFGEIYKVPGGGPAEFSATMEWNFGLRVDRYVMVNFGAFKAAVDALGGIDVDVPDEIYDGAYPAETGSGTVVFSLPAGQQHLDGETALRYARTRHQDDDYHRARRQQLVLLAIRNKVFSPEVIPQIPTLVATLGTLGRTDLTPTELAALTCIGAQIDRSAIIAQTIDANMVIPWTTAGGAQVSIPNRELITPVIDKFLGR
jgi:polyisoprenyl-teichoic acid--peptidoglycan teichoic acid transferase